MKINKKLQAKAIEVKKELAKYFKGSKEISDVFLAGVFSKAKILEWASHGKGKSLLAELIAQLCNCSYSRVQGSSGLTESKFLARYDLAKLMKGEEVVKWRDFVTAKIKLLDEINRTHPVLLNSIFSMLQEKKIYVGDDIAEVPNYVFIATMNPADSGTYELPPPLWDRFDICLLLQSLRLSDKLDILKNQPAERVKSLKPILKKDEIEEIWEDVEKVKIPRDIQVFITAITRDLQLCVYGEKEFLTNFPQCCEECYFKQWICSSLDNRFPVSERLYLSIFKVSKAYAYLKGRDTVRKSDVLTLLKYALFHRLKVTDTFSQKYFSKERVVNSIVEKLIEKDLERSDAYKLIKEIIEKGDEKNLQILKEYADKDLLLKEMYKEIKEQFDSRQKEFISSLESMSPLHLEQLRERIRTSDTYVPNTKAIIDRIDELLEPHLTIERKLNKKQYLRFVARISRVSTWMGKQLRHNMLETCSFEDTIMKVNVINSNNRSFAVTVKCRDLDIKKEVENILKEVRR